CRASASFRISARRAFKTYPLTSVELNRALGALVLEKVAARVDLREPELEIHVEVMPSETFVYVDRLPGPGGLPVGASGTVAALLSGGIDSPVAAWRMMKRGCRVVFVHFHSVPYLPATSQAKARALVERLTAWQYESRLLLVPFGEIQREVVLTVPPPARGVDRAGRGRLHALRAGAPGDPYVRGGGPGGRGAPGRRAARHPGHRGRRHRDLRVSRADPRRGRRVSRARAGRAPPALGALAGSKLCFPHARLPLCSAHHRQAWRNRRDKESSPTLRRDDGCRDAGDRRQRPRR